MTLNLPAIVPEGDINAESTDPAHLHTSEDTLVDIAAMAGLFPAYELIRVLGRGGMGAVYQARQPELDRFVAIKLLPLEISGSHDFAESFRREARAMAKLNHPNILTVYEFGTTVEGHLFFVMEYVEGDNLHEIIHTVGLKVDQALAVAEQICAALGYAHGKGVVHRDIKPGNVMVDGEAKVKVADFGLARLMDSSAEGGDGTPGGLVFGTPDYMAPEQMRAMDVDHRADIYSLGVLIYEMLCGEVPRGVFLAPSERVGCDPRIDQIVVKAMQQSVELRYQATKEMEDAVRAARTPLPAVRAVVRAQHPVRRAVVAGPARPRVPIPVPQDGSGRWVWILIVCGAGGYLLYHTLLENPAKSANAAVAAEEPALSATPAPVQATPIPAIAVVPAPAPPAVEPAAQPAPAKPTPKPQSEVEKWLADTDTQQQEAFEKQVTKPYEAAVADLRTRYLAVLDASLAKASAAKQIDLALAWASERQSFTETQGLDPNDPAVPSSIRSLRSDYRTNLLRLDQQRGERAKALYVTYDSGLTKYIGLLTQRQRLDDAVLLESKRKEIAKLWLAKNPDVAKPPLATPRATPAASGLPFARTTPAPSHKHDGMSLLELTPESSEVGSSETLIPGGYAYAGGQISVNGEFTKKWIAARAPSRVVYKLPPGIKAFSATAVRIGYLSPNATGILNYILKVDGKELYRSPKLDGINTQEVPIDVSLPAGASKLELIIESRESNKGAKSVWALPMLWK